MSQMLSIVGNILLFLVKIKLQVLFFHDQSIDNLISNQQTFVSSVQHNSFFFFFLINTQIDDDGGNPGNQKFIKYLVEADRF